MGRNIYKECVCGVGMVEKKGVLICGYCKRVIDPEKERVVHETHKNGSEIEHDEDYHQECQINSFIKSIEELGFEVIRPRSEINPNVNLDQGIDVNAIGNIIKEQLDFLSDITKADFTKMSPQERKDYEEKKKEAMEKVKKTGSETKPAPIKPEITRKPKMKHLTPQKKTEKPKTQNGKKPTSKTTKERTK